MAASIPKLMDDWVGHAKHPARVKLAGIGMSPEDKAAAVNILAKNTPTKMIGGQKHYLLHRTINEQEIPNIKDGVFDNLKAKVKIGWRKFPSVTSWTSSLYHIPANGRSTTVSAWIPESHLSFFPTSYVHMIPEFGGLVNNEQEAIVKPGKFTIAHTTKQDSKSIPSDVSTLHYMDRHARELARKEGLPFTPMKFKANPFS